MCEIEGDLPLMNLTQVLANAERLSRQQSHDWLHIEGNRTRRRPKNDARPEQANCQIHYHGDHLPKGRQISLGDRAPDGNITSCLTKRLGGRERLSTLHFPLLQRSQPYALVSRAQ